MSSIGAAGQGPRGIGPGPFGGGGSGGGGAGGTTVIISAPTYTLDDPDIAFLAIDCRSTAIIVTIASALIADPDWGVFVKDWYYNSATPGRSITFLTEGAELFDLETEAVMAANGRAWHFKTNGANMGVY